MKRYMMFLPALALSLLAACETVENPQQAVFAVRATHNTLLVAAVAYTGRPSCNLPMPALICASPQIAVAIDKADDAAATALDAAETTVRTPGFGDDVYQSAIVAAQAAITALSAILAASK